MKILVLTFCCILSGCSAVTTVADAAVDVTATVAKTTINVVGAVVP